MSDTLLLTAGEAGKALRMPPGRLVRLAKAGSVPCVRLPDGDLRFDPADLRAWVAKYKSPLELATPTGGTA